MAGRVGEKLALGELKADEIHVSESKKVSSCELTRSMSSSKNCEFCVVCWSVGMAGLLLE